MESALCKINAQIQPQRRTDRLRTNGRAAVSRRSSDKCEFQISPLDVQAALRVENASGLNSRKAERVPPRRHRSIAIQNPDALGVSADAHRSGWRRSTPTPVGHSSSSEGRIVAAVTCAGVVPIAFNEGRSIIQLLADRRLTASGLSPR